MKKIPKINGWLILAVLIATLIMVDIMMTDTMLIRVIDNKPYVVAVNGESVDMRPADRFDMKSRWIYE